MDGFPFCFLGVCNIIYRNLAYMRSIELFVRVVTSGAELASHVVLGGWGRMDLVFW